MTPDGNSMARKQRMWRDCSNLGGTGVGMYEQHVKAENKRVVFCLQ